MAELLMEDGVRRNRPDVCEAAKRVSQTDIAVVSGLLPIKMQVTVARSADVLASTVESMSRHHTYQSEVKKRFGGVVLKILVTRLLLNLISNVVVVVCERRYR